MKLSFGKKHKNDEPPTASSGDTIEANRLRELCEGDNELYNAMSRLMLLDPTRVIIPFDQVVSNAQDYEAQGNKLRAGIAYRIAGGISLYKGDLAGVEKFFSKAASIAGGSQPEFQTIVNKAKSAIEVARKFYGESGFSVSLSEP